MPTDPNNLSKAIRRKHLDDPEYRVRLSEGQKRKYASDPVYRAKAVERFAKSRAEWDFEAKKEYNRVKMTKHWSDPEYKTKLYAKHQEMLEHQRAHPPADNEIPCVINGVAYRSRKAASRDLGWSDNKVRTAIAAGGWYDPEMGKSRRGPKPQVCVINGVELESITEARNYLWEHGIGHAKLGRYIKQLRANGFVLDVELPT